ncbi:MAG: methionyl-tRNA synthetase [Oceanicoccus sp.]
MNKFYLTNAIAYGNAPPHIGHALELAQGDCLTRYERTREKDVRFLIGMDEHGTKINQTASDRGITPQELVDESAQHFHDLAKGLGLAHDQFIRTTDDLHKRGAQKLWKLIEDAGKFYDKEYEGLYCSGCELFVMEKDLVDGNCINHNRPPELLKETNIFFKLSDYSEEIIRLVESDEMRIIPESKKNEFLSFFKEGFLDVSFSRPKSSLPWGIEVPGREDQVMYVWCDALSNYLTALGYADDDEKVAQYWPADVHLIGKDIVRFHAAYWPAMLLAAGLPLPKAIYVHGFVTSEGKKMSKSIGNVVSPMEVLDKWGREAFRYYLLREIPSDDDGDFSWERFSVLYQDELSNTIGNLIRRVVSMVIKFNGGLVPEGTEADEAIAAAKLKYHKHFEAFEINKAIGAIVELAWFANTYVQENEPWVLAKEAKTERLNVVLGSLIQACRAIGEMLKPILPDSASKILDQVGWEEVVLGEPLFPHIEG